MSKKPRRRNLNRVTVIGGFLYGVFSQHPEITIDSLAKTLNRRTTEVERYFCTPGIKFKTLIRLLKAAFPGCEIYIDMWGLRNWYDPDFLNYIRKTLGLGYKGFSTRVGGRISAETLKCGDSTNISAVKFVEILYALDPECKITARIYRDGSSSEYNLTNVIMRSQLRSIKSS